MTDAGQPADDPSSVPSSPTAPRLPPRWVRRIAITGAVGLTLVVALPGLVWAILRRPRPGGDSTMKADAALSIEQEETGERH